MFCKRVFPNKKKSNGFNFVYIFVHAAYPPLSNLYYKLFIPQDLPPEGAKNHTQELDQGHVCSLLVMYLCCRSLLLKLVKSEEPPDPVSLRLSSELCTVALLG